MSFSAPRTITVKRLPSDLYQPCRCFIGFRLNTLEYIPPPPSNFLL